MSAQPMVPCTIGGGIEVLVFCSLFPGGTHVPSGNTLQYEGKGMAWKTPDYLSHAYHPPATF